MGIEKDKVNVNDFKKKVENIKAKLNVPIQVHCLCLIFIFVRRPKIPVQNLVKIGVQIFMYGYPKMPDSYQNSDDH